MIEKKIISLVPMRIERNINIINFYHDCMYVMTAVNPIPKVTDAIPHISNKMSRNDNFDFTISTSSLVNSISMSVIFR